MSKLTERVIADMLDLLDDVASGKDEEHAHRAAMLLSDGHWSGCRVFQCERCYAQMQADHEDTAACYGRAP